MRTVVAAVMLMVVSFSGCFTYNEIPQEDTGDMNSNTVTVIETPTNSTTNTTADSTTTTPPAQPPWLTIFTPPNSLYCVENTPLAFRGQTEAGATVTLERGAPTRDGPRTLPLAADGTFDDRFDLVANAENQFQLLLTNDAGTEDWYFWFYYAPNGCDAGTTTTSSTTSSTTTTSPPPPAPPTCEGQAATIYVENGVIVGGPNDGQAYNPGITRLDGTDGADVIVGTDGVDNIHGLGGNDLICALGGDDEVNGGSDDDQIYGGAGDDDLDGSGGDNLIDGGPGMDRCHKPNASQGAVNCEE